MKALHFGAGNIGRGFIGKLLADVDGAEITFADIEQPLIDQLNQQGSYQIKLAGEEHCTLVNNIRAVHSDSEAVIEHIATTQLITTAVGAGALGKIAAIMARGLARRYERYPKTFLNIIACENIVRGTTRLKDQVLCLLPQECHAWIDAQVGFVDSVVDRIVPPAPAEAIPALAVTVEAFGEWIVDSTQIRGELPPIVGLETTRHLTAFSERKLFTLNTGHVITAYLGLLAGYSMIHQAIADPQIAVVVRGAMQESGAVLVKRHGFSPQRHMIYVDHIIDRFSNPWLRDEVTRVGRQPLRKLGANERLIKPLLGTLEHQLPRHYLVKGVAAVLLYRNEGDQEAVEMQRRITQEGSTAILIGHCGLPSGHPIVAEITETYAKYLQQYGDDTIAR